MAKKMRERLIIKQNKIVSSGNEKSNQIVEKAILQIERFFGKKIDFNIIFLETREEMDKLHSEIFGKGYKSEDWVVGGVFDDNTVYIFQEEVYSKVSSHLQETFFATLVHEITHIFIRKLFNFYFPIWLNEGIAYVVAEQDKEPLEKKQDLVEAYTEQEWIQTNPYLTAGKFVRFLFEKYGKDKLFELLVKLNSNKKREIFEQKFKEIFGKSFNSIWNEWI
jgi:hypothetical protein